MSLNVLADLLDRAERGPVDDAEFVACVRESLPYAWQVISGVVAELETARRSSLTTRLRRLPIPTAASCCARWPRTPSEVDWNATSA